MSTEATKDDTVDVADDRITYTRARGGPATVLIHGIPANRYLWRNVVPLLQSGERLARTMLHGRFEVVEGAGYFLPEDAPGRLAGFIASFVTSAEGTC